MAARSGTPLSLPGHFLILNLVFIITVHHICCQSYGVRPMRKWSLVSTANSSAVENIVDTDTLSCVTFTGRTPTINIWFDLTALDFRNAAIRTVITYVPKDDSSTYGTDGSPMKVSDGFREDFTVSHTFSTGTSTVYVWSSNGGYHSYDSQVRIGLQRQTSQTNRTLTLCEVKVYDVTLRTYCTCDDRCSRNMDYICNSTEPCSTPATDCYMDNVALHKKATMSSTYIKSGDASLAVNGNTGTTFSGPGYTSDTRQWNCIQTDDNDDTPYWEVDLGQNYTVQSITIFRRGSEECSTAPGGISTTTYECEDSGRHRMENTRVTVDGQTCFNITDVRDLPEKNTKSCRNELTGRKVRLSRFKSSLKGGPSLNLCELQVWVCKRGRYGSGCRNTCSTKCWGGQTKCDAKGNCVFGCVGNWGRPKCTECDDTHYGPDCQKECGHCDRGAQCRKDTGVCPTGCAAGWGPDRYCKTPCSQGKYGRDCRNTCSKGCVDITCDPRDGSCACRAGWDPSDAKCQKGCGPGFYGSNCGYRCSDGCAADCDDVTGHCDCRTGWIHVDQTCNTKCPKGSYGDNCNMTCGHCAGSSACEHDTGHCTEGCADGFMGDNCQMEGSAGVHAVTIIFIVLIVIAVPGVVAFLVIRWQKRKRFGRNHQGQGLPNAGDNRRSPVNQEDEAAYEECQPLPISVGTSHSSRPHVRGNRGQATSHHVTHVMQPLAGIELRDAAPYVNVAKASSRYENITYPRNTYDNLDFATNRDRRVYKNLMTPARKGAANKR